MPKLSYRPSARKATLDFTRGIVLTEPTTTYTNKVSGINNLLQHLTYVQCRAVLLG